MRELELTEEQVVWLKEHYPNMVNSEIIKHLGITIALLRKFRIRYGLKKTSDHVLSMRRANATKASNTPGRDYSAQRENIMRLREQGRLTHSNHVSHWNMIDDKLRQERCAKISEGRKMLIESERKRIRWGLKPMTNLKILQERNIPRSRAKWRLTKKRKYIFIEKWVFGYTDKTKRVLRTEERYSQLFKFKFIEINNDYEEEKPDCM